MPRPKRKVHKGLLNDALAKRIAKHVRKGNFFRTACALENIAEDTARNWLAEGRKDFTEGNQTPKTPQGRFAKLIMQAYAKAEEKAANRIQKGIKQSWVAAAWWLTHGPSKQTWGAKQQGITASVKLSIQDQVAPRLSGMSGEILEAEYSRMDNNLKMIEETASAGGP